ncbi:hypothetical protein [Marinomonas fungiae]|uniref:Uncharacterized protein n=1 Tax=Marinomonas fungiae TaxID=1137284 RepID=A0A0K6IUV4_9GAMM|nr:hypothetical protein [Marinomonas fungiae]CUB06859.1 hypothetical protein Ga0061065_1247 [Marinomonas fungiae]
MKRSPYQEVSALLRVYNLLTEIDEQHMDGRSMFHFNKTTRQYLENSHKAHNGPVATAPEILTIEQLANVHHTGQHLLAIYAYMISELSAQKLEMDLLERRFIESVLEKYTQCTS